MDYHQFISPNSWSSRGAGPVGYNGRRGAPRLGEGKDHGMTGAALGAASYQRDLDGGLRLRWATAADAERLAALYTYVFRDRADDPVDQMTVAWLADMHTGRHPLISPDDFALVEEIDGGRVVAAANLMIQRWQYEGVDLSVGRPEAVASHPDYRRRGLIRRLFEVLHARSAARGDLALIITGIDYYYRQFGYEYALDLGGGWTLPLSAIPALAAGATEPYTLRPATLDDLPVIQPLYDRDRAAGPVSTVITPDYWRWVLTEQSPASGEGWSTLLIVEPAGRPVGYVMVRRTRRQGALAIIGLGVVAGVPLPRVLPPVLRALREQAPLLLINLGESGSIDAIAFALGLGDHPAYAVLDKTVVARRPPGGTLYVRVPDLPALLRHVAPALAARLAGSAAAGWSGELRLTFYRGGLRLRFDAGRLTLAEDWQEEVWGEPAHAGFPPLVFLQLLFGHRDLAALRASFPDVWADAEARVVLTALFPTRPSWVLPLD
jgi:predicted N-acetyltransferase YhbS